jgi:osmotically-inducible protein OsmY
VTRHRSDTRSHTSTHLTDEQIAAEATKRLAWDAAVPRNAVQVKVSHGRLTLLGILPHDQQRIAALEDVSRLFGVAGVSDHTRIEAK